MKKLSSKDLLIKKRLKSARYSIFDTKTGLKEVHLVISPLIKDFKRCLKKITVDYNLVLKKERIPKDSVFCSRIHIDNSYSKKDLSKFIAKLSLKGCSVIEQKPLNGSVALYVWFLISKNRLKKQSFSVKKVSLKGENYNLLFVSELTGNGNTTYTKTESIFNCYKKILLDAKMDLKRNFLRSWIYISDIYKNYSDVVKARRNFFYKNGISKKTIFPASTGIGCNSSKTVKADFLSIGRIKREQIFPLKSKLMPRPSLYGVTFERGLAILFGDREHLYISGTASIGKRGEILHKDNITRQTKTTIKNIFSLLRRDNSSIKEIAEINIYIKDEKDYKKVKKVIDVVFSDKTPYIILMAKVCRPDWLVEIDGIAIKSINTCFPDFK